MKAEIHVHVVCPECRVGEMHHVHTTDGRRVCYCDTPGCPNQRKLFAMPIVELEEVDAEIFTGPGAMTLPPHSSS